MAKTIPGRHTFYIKQASTSNNRRNNTCVQYSFCFIFFVIDFKSILKLVFLYENICLSVCRFSLLRLGYIYSILFPHKQTHKKWLINTKLSSVNLSPQNDRFQSVQSVIYTDKHSISILAGKILCRIIFSKQNTTLNIIFKIYSSNWKYLCWNISSILEKIKKN